MMMLRYVADFFSGLWLWNMTWDWYHVPINFLLLCLLFNIFAHMNIVQSVLLSLLAHLYAYIIFSLLVAGFLTYLLNYSYDPNTATYVPDPAHACFYLGTIYAALQISFLALVNIKYKLHLFTAMVVVIISNCLSAGIAYWLLPVV